MHLPRLSLGKVIIAWAVLFLVAGWVSPPIDSGVQPHHAFTVVEVICGVLLLVATPIAAFVYFKGAWQKVDSVPNKTPYVIWLTLETIAAVVITAILAWFAFLGMRAFGEPSLSGPYVFQAEKCDSGAVFSSHLRLYPNGTYEQHHKLNDGRAIDVYGKHWRYHQGVLRLEDFRLNGKGERLAGLDVAVKADPRRPPIIMLPDSNCFYSGPK